MWNYSFLSLSVLALFGGACDNTSTGAPDAATTRDAAADASSGNDGALPAWDAASDAQAAVDAADPVGDAERADAGAADACSDCCSDGFPRGDAGKGSRLVAPFTPSPEGVTVCANGDVFVALDGNGDVWRIPLAGGSPEHFASVGDRQPAGITCDDQGRLFVAIYAVRTGNPVPAPSVVMIPGKDAAPVVLPYPAEAPALGGLNGIIAVPGLGVYASDTPTNRIVLWREGAPGVFTGHVVASDVSSANGLAYDGDSRTMYVALSINQRVLSYAVAADGTLSARADAATGKDVIGFWDGVAVAEGAALYTASFLAGNVLRVADNTPVGAVPSPASLAFRGGTLFATDYKFGQPDQAGGLYAIDLGVCGAARGKAPP